jgi:hypothetical protein
VEGVKRVYELNGRLMAFEVGGREVRTYVMALEFAGGSGSPEGSESRPEKGTIVLDNTSPSRPG